MVSLLPTKFHEILFSSFRGVALTSCFSSIFRKILSSKRHNSHKIQEIKISWSYAQLHMVSLLPTKFHEILFSSFRGIALTSCFRSIFGKIFKFKGAELPQNLGNQNFLVICTTTYGVLTTYQVS